MADERNKQQEGQRNADIERLEKQFNDLRDSLDPFKLAPRIVDIMIDGRGDKTAYVSGGFTVECDVMLDIEWQGRRYRIPAFEL